MYCVSCGEQIPDDSRFCEFCGNPIEDDPTPVPFEEKVEESREEQTTSMKTNSETKEYMNREVKGKGVKDARSYDKPRSKIRIFPFILIAILLVGGYLVVKALSGDQGSNISDLPGTIIGKDEEDNSVTREDFSWYVPASYDEVPEGGVPLAQEDILGAWKVMTVNYVSEPEEAFFSTLTLKNNTSTDLNTAVEFLHHYVEYDARDLLYADFEDGILYLALGDDRLAMILFWEKGGKEYGQSHIYSDWDNDGMADLVNVMLFVRE